MSTPSDSEGTGSDFEVLSTSPSPEERENARKNTSELNFCVLSENLDQLASFSDFRTDSSEKKLSTATFSDNISSQFSNSEVSSSTSSSSHVHELRKQLDEALARADRLQIEKNELEKIIEDMKANEEEQLVIIEEEKEARSAVGEHVCPFEFKLPCPHSKVIASVLILTVAIHFGLFLNDSSKNELAQAREQEKAVCEALYKNMEKENQRFLESLKQVELLQDEIKILRGNLANANKKHQKLDKELKTNKALYNTAMDELTNHKKYMLTHLESFNDWKSDMMQKINQVEISRKEQKEEYQKRLDVLEQEKLKVMGIVEALMEFATGDSHSAHDRYGFDKPFKECMEILPHEKLCRLLADGFEYQAEEIATKINRYAQFDI